MSEIIQIVTTTVSLAEARAIARALVERRLAACVQIAGPVESVYRWKGAIESAQEWQCWIKTRSELFHPIEQAIAGLHSYELPEILALPATASAGYLRWVHDETQVE
jgi:periplasmic divalent cation tolerance protein